MPEVHPIKFTEERRDVACREETIEIWLELDAIAFKMAEVVKKLMDKTINIGKGDDMERELFARCSAKTAHALTRMISEIHEMRP